MKNLISGKLRIRAAVAFALVALAGLGSVAVADSGASTKPAKKGLDGAQLYAINCNRCHSERYPTERTKAQWKTILMHMRVRANLPPDQAKAILKYLEENN